MRGIGIAVVLAAAVGCAPGDAASRGELLVRASEGELFVDAREHGSASGDVIVGLSAGTHVVELRRGALVLARASVEVRGGGTVELALEPGDGLAVASDAAVSGRLDLTSAPPGAVLLVDGQDAGITPVAIDLLPGPHHVTLSALGFAPYEQDLFVGAGTSITLDVVLTPTP